MEAKDTVLTPEEIKQGCSAYIDHGGGIGIHCRFKPTLRFGGRLYCTRHNPVRLKDRMDKRLAQDKESRIQAERNEENAKNRLRQAGIREVVEWIDSNPIFVQSNSLGIKVPIATDSKWQAQLKEWGIE